MGALTHWGIHAGCRGVAGGRTRLRPWWLRGTKSKNSAAKAELFGGRPGYEGSEFGCALAAQERR